MNVDPRRVAVALAGFCAFVNLYAPQSVLPLLAQDFAVGAVKISAAVTASTLAVALIAPFSGAAADVLGRKRVITVAMFALVVPTAMVALAADLPVLIFWRFVQGLVLPPIFVVTVAYIGEEWPTAQIGGSIGGVLPGLAWNMAALARMRCPGRCRADRRGGNGVVPMVAERSQSSVILRCSARERRASKDARPGAVALRGRRCATAPQGDGSFVWCRCYKRRLHPCCDRMMLKCAFCSSLSDS